MTEETEGSTATEDSTPAAAVAESSSTNNELPSGLKFELPASGGVSAKELAEDAVEETDAGVDDLMAQLQNLTSGN